jgi:cytoskeletal protein CcmA (bactofilin family)
MGTTIGKGVNITGSLTADEPVSILGMFHGEVLVANHAVTVETGGRVDGAVTARVITVQGGSAGRLIARDVVRVLHGATVNADVASPKLALEEGAVFNGKVDGGVTRAEAAVRVAKYRTSGPSEPAQPRG